MLTSFEMLFLYMDDVLKQINEMFDEVIANSDKKSLGQILIEKRLSLNLKVDDIIRITNLSGSFIKSLENDEINDIKISELKKLVYAYDIPPKVFIDRLGGY